MKKRDFWTAVVVVSIIYIGLSFWIYFRLESQLSRAVSLKKQEEKCPRAYSPRHAHFSGNTAAVRQISTTWPTCQAKLTADQHGVDIQMEREWAFIKVAYPKFILTVSGWVPDLQVPYYTVKGGDRPLHVIVVPHSHQDPGWLSTFSQYYDSYTKGTLDNAVEQLTKNPTWKFIWAEMIFLAKWWETASQETKDKFLKLVSEGRLEIVTAGWVMSDEGNVHYEAMLDQLIEGQQWLNSNIGVEAKTGWSVDQFGYSPTMTYLMKNTGIENLVIQRVHYSIKKHLAATRNLEFNWRQAWASDVENDLFCHVMPFLSYSIMYSCGPEPHVCCKFDFQKDKCLRGKKTIKPEVVTEKNVEKLSWELWEQLQKKAHLYKSNVLLVPHGDDFRYFSESEWTKQLTNLEKIFTFMNSKSDFHIKIEFGTLRDYFTALEKDKPHFTDKSPFPSLSGDFFPYTDRSDQYWSGYFTSRPLYKHITRVLQAKVRLLDIWYTLCYARAMRRQKTAVVSFLRERFPIVVSVRRANGHFQHHDAITGTSSSSVTKDYANILLYAMEKADAVIGAITTIFMTDGPLEEGGITSHITPIEEWKHFDEPLMRNAFNVDEKRTVIISNPLTTRRREVVRITTLSPRCCILVAFMVDLPPLSMKTFYLTPSKNAERSFARVSAFNTNFAEDFKKTRFRISTGQHPRVLELDNGYYRLSFSPCTGFLQHVHRKVDDWMYEVQLKMMTYDTGSWFKDKSGAYTFQPNGPATELDIEYPEMMMVDGPVMSAVYTSVSGILHSATVFKVEGSTVAGLHLENLVNLNSEHWDNKELVMRLDSSIYNREHSICTDLNGFQMHRKQYQSKLTMQGNFHPLSTAAYIEDSLGSRLTLLTTETHGVANLEPGWLEVVLDRRRLMQGDWRGLNEGVKNNMPTPSHFVLMLEKSRRKLDAGPPVPACFLSPTSHLLSQSLLHPLSVGVVKTGGDALGTRYLPQLSLVNKSLPPALGLVNLRTLGVNDTQAVTSLLIVHRAGLDCDVTETLEDEQNMQESPNLKLFEDVNIVSALETNLNGLKIKKKMSSYEMNVPPMELRTFKLSLG
ncbi:LOW QUALITY PROTEIN: alpha-mannosidase 2-like [Haliotis rubra]|uniref:LOW QUALITY PROTEIN: alpha-mannosidase 2-like n=1 Tax=Haliotis rubra TaxID=36100 RepID=UPI001EE5FF01|nr:LOW QUALITY PROTEIN: alpha-mannosidase 2-like [Haliotis rubra]